MTLGVAQYLGLAEDGTLSMNMPPPKGSAWSKEAAASFVGQVSRFKIPEDGEIRGQLFECVKAEIQKDGALHITWRPWLPSGVAPVESDIE